MQECMNDFVANFLGTSQLLYDLMPLMASLGDDPYLAEFSEGKKLVDLYYDMT